MTAAGGKRRYGFALLGLAVLAGLAFCGDWWSAPWALHRRPNVVVIVIDTLRADHLPFHGYERNTASFLKSLADESLVFEKTWAPSSWTAPASASLFTSTYPGQHGVTAGDRYYRGPEAEELPSRLNRIPAELETLGEMFRRRGYRTFGVSDNYFVSPECGFARGFDRFMHFNDLSAARVNDTILRWKPDLEGSRKPYFLYVHYMDPHWPYTVHPEGYREGTPETFSVRAYDSEIGFVDQKIRELFDLLRLRDEAVVVVTADHGEEFQDHGGEGHRFQLYQELIHVPLLIRFPRDRYTPRRIPYPVSLVDLLPTLREVAGDQPARQDMGVNLMGLIRDGHFEIRPLFALRTKETADAILETKKAVLFGDRKYILTLPSGQEEFYDLMADPDETKNLAKVMSGDADVLRDKIEAFENNAPVAEREFVDIGKLSPDLKEKLRSLGYLH